MIVGAVCMSHSPLIDGNRTASSVEEKWDRAIEDTAAELRPDVSIVFYPDHLNGFLHDLLPAFYIGAGGISLGGFGTAPERLDIPEDLAAQCRTRPLD